MSDPESLRSNKVFVVYCFVHAAGTGIESSCLWLQVADYIPQLARFSPDLWGAALCTVDGQRYGFSNRKRFTKHL